MATDHIPTDHIPTEEPDEDLAKFWTEIFFEHGLENAWIRKHV